MLSSLSGIVINQNQRPDPAVNGVPLDTSVYQEFILPSNYRRGVDPGEQVYPPLTGFQIALDVEDAATTWVEYTVERKVFGLPWSVVQSGTVTGATASGAVIWFDVYFDDPISIDPDSADDRWRFSVRSNASAWASTPNPLSIPGGVKAYESDGTTALTSPLGFTPGPPQMVETSLMFRILAATADNGIDFLGNNFRSAVIDQSAANVTTGEGSNDDTFWLSKPNPSKFAVESLYFDVRPLTSGNIDQQEAVIDRVTIDPITPGVYFNIYYSSEGDPGTTPEEWDNKLWTHIPQTYRMMKREGYVLPEPIVTKYVKIEFSHLQAQPYTPGDFAQPIAYKKHPKWVLDYFLVRTATDLPVANSVGVVWDALDLAYNYYLDDLNQEPDQPVTIDPLKVDTVTSFLKQNNDRSDQIDAATLGKINLALEPFTQHPVQNTNADSILHIVQQGLMEQEYPVESYNLESPDFSDVSSLRRESLVFEANYPVMFFYLTCRHAYRELTATFSHNRAYFVGVREVAFTRENYTTAHDTDLYIMPTGDNVNLEYNDFETENGQWVVYN